MKFYPLILALSLVSLCAYSQNSLKGSIVNDKSEPVSFCQVALLNSSDSALVKGNICDEHGKFIFENFPAGNYILSAAAVGFEKFYSQIFTVDSTSALSLKTFFLAGASVNLNEISVNTIRQSIEFKEGMIVMNVEGSPLSAGNTVFELLKRLPGVFIDAQNNIFLNGKSGVRIMIDGRLQRIPPQQLTAILMGMSAESVSKMEVMNNPPVKYDAEGAGGMINIVTKKVKIMGWSGDFRQGASMGEAWRFSTDCSLNYKGRNFSVFSNYGYAHRDFYSDYIFNKVVTLNGNATYLNENGEQFNYQRLIYYRAGADWFPTEKTTLGIMINGGPASTPMRDKGINRISGYNDVGFDYSLFDVRMEDHWRNPGININAEHKFDTLGTVLNLSADYTFFSGDKVSKSNNYFYNEQGFESVPSNNIISSHLTSIHILTERLDFRKNIRAGVMMETGVKGTHVSNSNEYSLERKDQGKNIFVTDSIFSNHYVYSEDISAGYLNFRKQRGKISLQFGARGEYTQARGKDLLSAFTLSRSYFNFFPNFTFDYNGNNHGYQFRIDRRINRPGYQDLNPYKSYQDNYSIHLGNTSLVPQLNLGFTFVYSYKKNIFNTFSYIRAKNFILHYDFQNDSTKETASTKTNLNGNNYHIWYNFYTQKQITKWWTTSVSSYLNYFHYEGDLQGGRAERTAFTFNFWTNQDILLPRQVKMQLTFNYNSPNIYGIFYFHQMWSLDLGFKKSFLKEKLTLTATMFDLFYTNVEHIEGKFQGLDILFVNPKDTRRFWVSVAYRFGKVRVQKRQVEGNESEKGRIENKMR